MVVWGSRLIKISPVEKKWKLCLDLFSERVKSPSQQERAVLHGTAGALDMKRVPAKTRGNGAGENAEPKDASVPEILKISKKT